MANLPNFSNRQLNARLEAYYRQMLALAASSVAGDLARPQFVREMEQLMRAAIPLMFRLSGGDLNRADAQQAIQQRLAEDMDDLAKLAADIGDGRYSPTDAQTTAEAIAKLENRLSLRVFSMAGVYTVGQEYRPGDERLVWRLGNTKEHCRHCFGLNGATLTVSEWNQLGIRPQGRELECGGYRCDCERVPTDAESVGLDNLFF